MAKKAGRKSTTEPPTRTLKYKLSPDEFAQFKKEQAALDRGRATIDRYIAIRDNQIPPPWAESAEAKPDPLPRRRPGPRPTNDWPTFVTIKVRALKRSGEPIPTAAELCQLCENELGYQPDVSDMQKLLKPLLS